MSKDLRQFLVEDCQKNKQIQSCKQCLYEKECDQTHINIIIKAIGQWIASKKLGIKPCKKVVEFRDGLIQDCEKESEVRK